MGELIISQSNRSSNNKYLPEYAEQMLQYFLSCPQTMQHTTKAVLETSHREGKSTRQEVQTICGEIPTFERFATSIGVAHGTIWNWSKAYPEFAEAHERCKQIQKDFLIQGLVSGRISPLAGIFLAKNMTDMRDDSGVTVRQEKPMTKPALADRTPAELEELRKLAVAAERMGITITLEEA